jgi:hypothetical protein
VSQFKGEIFTLRSQFPDQLLNGCRIEYHIKRWGPVKGKDTRQNQVPCRCANVDATGAELDAWRLSCVNILVGIDEAVDGFHNDLNNGVDLETSAHRWFPKLGMFNASDVCWGYNRPCEFMDLCLLPDKVEQFLRSYRPRTPRENRDAKEYSG